MVECSITIPGEEIGSIAGSDKDNAMYMAILLHDIFNNLTDSAVRWFQPNCIKDGDYLSEEISLHSMHKFSVL